jgi:protein subunit release factor B
LGLAGGVKVALGDENWRTMDLPSQIRERLDALGVLPGDVTEVFVRGSGAGGQKINKTSSTVVLRHGPSGVEVRCQEERSQAVNRERAWERFCEKLEERLRVAEAARVAARAKARRTNRPRSARQKAKLVAGKRRRAEVKATRRAPE